MNILIIQILRLGDALQLTPIIKGLKEVFKDSKISVLTSSLGAKILSPQEEIAQIYEMNIEELVLRIKSSEIEDVLAAVDILKNDLEDVLNKEWDWVINFNYTFASALLSHLADGASHSGFYATSKRQFFVKENWFAYILSAFVNRKYSVFNWIDINKNIIKLPSTPRRTFFPVEKVDTEEIKARLGEKTFGNHKVIGIAPGASNDYKKWPLENFIELASRLIKRHDLRILILGDEKEREMGLRIKQGAGPGCEDLTGKTTLPQLAANLSKCDLLVSNDSGPMHMANSVGTPVVGLFFSTHFSETGPYSEDNFVVFPDIPCFPCQGPAKCPDKRCRTLIKPETIEKIISQRDHYIKNGGALELSEHDGPVSVNRSVFDPWGNLDWIPIDKRPLKTDDLLRLAFRPFWLSALNSDGILDEEIVAYLKHSINNFGTFKPEGKITKLLDHFDQTMEKVGGLYHECHKLSLQICDMFLKGNQKTVNYLGEMLWQKEAEVADLGEADYLRPLTEYIKLRLDNIEEKDMMNLAVMTAGLYGEAENLSKKFKKTVKQALSFIPHQF